MGGIIKEEKSPQDYKCNLRIQHLILYSLVQLVKTEAQSVELFYWPFKSLLCFRVQLVEHYYSLPLFKLNWLNFDWWEFWFESSDGFQLVEFKVGPVELGRFMLLLQLSRLSLRLNWLRQGGLVSYQVDLVDPKVPPVKDGTLVLLLCHDR